MDNGTKKMAGVPNSVQVKMPAAIRGMNSASTGGQGSGNPVGKIKTNSKGRAGGTTC